MSDAARDRLRQYLEQRRELGERELVLDSMQVDDVLRVIGARRPAGEPLKSRPRPAPAPDEAAADAPAEPTAAAPPEVDEDVGAPADHPRLQGEGAPGAQDALPPAPALEPEAADRVGQASEAALDAAAAGDWRAALRASGASAEAPRSEPARPEPSRPEPPSHPAPEPESMSNPSTYVTGELFPGLDVPIGVVAQGAGTDLFGGPTEGLDSLEHLAQVVNACTRCQLYKTATHGVPGEGPLDAQLVVVGEAPGADEDASGRPFVGASGQLLTKILAAFRRRRLDVFIANVVKHRPPGTATPRPTRSRRAAPILSGSSSWSAPRSSSRSATSPRRRCSAPSSASASSAARCTSTTGCR